MSARRRNEWQEAEEDEDEDGYDSEASDQRKDSRARSHKAKRRKVANNTEEEEETADESDDDDSSQDRDNLDSTVPTINAKRKIPASIADHNDGTITSPAPSPKVITPAAVKLSIAASKKTGVVYLSRVPPFMKPQKVKQLLSRFGTVGRVFLQPEDPASYARRKRYGGNKKRSFDDGWVEFVDKEVAKLVVETLNATTIGKYKLYLPQECLVQDEGLAILLIIGHTI